MVDTGAESDPDEAVATGSPTHGNTSEDKMHILKSLIGLTQAIHGVYDSIDPQMEERASATSPTKATTSPIPSGKHAHGVNQQHKAPSILPPPQLDDEVGNGLSMSRAEYVQRQNQVFQDLTGHKTPNEARLAAEKVDPHLVSMMEVYMKSLDARIHKEMTLQHKLNDITVDASTDVLAQILDIANDDERDLKLVNVLATLRDEFTALQFRTNAMIHQRCQLESQRTYLKQQYAAELSKRVRLDHTVRLMSKKLVELNSRVEKAEAAAKDGDRQRELQVKAESLETLLSASEIDSDDKVLAELSKETTDMASLDAKLRLLYREIGRMQKLESMKEIPDTPEKILARILVYVDNGRGRKNQHVKDLVKAYLDLFDARERQLTDALNRSLLENEIYLARCDRLTQKTEEQAEDMRDLLDRTVDLVLTDKQLREGLSLNLEGIELRDIVLKRCLSFIQNIQSEAPQLFNDRRTGFLDELDHFIKNSRTLGNFEQSYCATEASGILSRLNILDKLDGVDVKELKLQIPGHDPIPLSDIFSFKKSESSQ